MRVKICGVRTGAGLKAAVTAGADAVGLLVGQVHASPDFILPSTAARLASELPPYISPVIVTHLSDPEQILDIVEQTGINSVQLHGGSSPDQVAFLRDSMPPASKLILAIHVAGSSFEPELSDYFKLVNAFLLDTRDKASGKVGGTGQTHNWDLSAEIVKSSPLPVILAGGLNPDNVAVAIEKVRPYAVDANSGLRDPSGDRCPILCGAFVENALAAFLKLRSPSV